MRAQLVRSEVEERLRLGVSPHAPYTVRPELFRALAEYAEKRGLMQTIHIAETQAESDLIRSGVGPFAEMFARRDIPWQAQNLSPVAYVDRCGGLDTRTLAVHTVHTSADDAALLKSRGASIAHCPKSNGKLAAGFAPLRMLMDPGLDVGLGTDSMVSNNCADMFEEMRMALFQARNLSGDVTALKAKEALFLATQGGANAIGMGDEIGSLRAEKRADLCVVRLDGLNTAAVAADDPIAALVFGGRASDVVMTMVGGKVVYEGGKPMLIDVPRVRTVIDAVRASLWKKAERVLGVR
jgi:5-methylthioadenosine/S-adenosylhomocysteine deaminase